uniref:YTH domain-containing family protein n=1 Tax=Lactuca sativa TaxID=4236 RepID=A0A9R1VHH5_LACSA|nr:hypothetical protein LSAT_V11C500258230 [Lactuca sativa]
MQYLKMCFHWLSTIGSLHGDIDSGDGLVPDNYMDKPLSPKDERIVSPNPSPDAALTGSMRNISNQSEPLNASGAPTPAIYNENASSLLFHPAYGFDYSQFSPVASPMSPIMIDGQLFSPHQVPISPSYYSQPVSPNLPQTDLSPQPNSGMQMQEGLGDNVFMAPSPGSGDIGSNESMSSDTSSFVSPITSGGLYPAPLGILGSYEHIFSQIPQQQAGYGYGYGSVSGSGSSTRRYPQSGSFRGHNYGNNSIFQGEASRLNRFIPEKGGKHRDKDGISMISEPHGTTSDRNRGPRASKAKGEQILSPEGKIDLYNQPDFVTSYENAKFFVIKSFSEDNVHKSIKYSVWASTPLGNRKLDAAYQEAKESEANCPVNASGQFCGVAEMVGPVDFVNDAEYWQQDRWSGQFRVKWHIIKDVPNSRFRHILLENNDNKPVTHSRDSQEVGKDVKLEVGIAMLKIFKDHDAETSILDDFGFYDEREKDLQEKRSKEREFTKNTLNVNDTSITQLADKVADSLHVDEKTEIQ